MHGGLGDNVAVETVAQVDRVDVVAFEIRVPAPPSAHLFPRSDSRLQQPPDPLRRRGAHGVVGTDREH